MRDRPLLLLAAAGLIAACGPGERATRPAPASAVALPAGATSAPDGRGRAGADVRLVDSARTGDELGMEDVVSYRVEVAAAGRRDTLAGVRVRRAPASAPDGAVHGVAVGPEGQAAGTFRYDPADRRLTRTPAPADASPFFSELTLSPDARHIAYVAQESGPVVRLWGVVRAWPDGRVVARAEPAPGYPSDVNYSQVRWTGPDTYEVVYRVDERPGRDPALAAGPWIRMRGSTRGGSPAVDTLAAEPGAAQVRR
jgi:hypothetical protein